MEYRKIKDVIYIRLDWDDEVISSILEICEKEKISFATFSGIGGCREAEIMTFDPETRTFECRKFEGLLELSSLNGNVLLDETGKRHHHTHAVFALKENGEHIVAAGHMRSIIVSYTAEIELHPVSEEIIRWKYFEETGTGIWDFVE